MNFYTKLIVSLAATAGVAGGLLALTYNTTKPIIEKREIEERAKALEKVFFLQADPSGKQGFSLEPKEVADGVTALFGRDNPDKPLYYAVTGKAAGYNSSVPVTLMVGFTSRSDDAASLLKGYLEDANLPKAGEKGEYLVGFSVLNSEETPGLGEKIKDTRPPYTWTQAFAGKKPAPNPDQATDFHRQFRGRQADQLSLKKNGGELDAITAATITSNGVLAAIRDADEKLHKALAEAN